MNKPKVVAKKVKKPHEVFPGNLKKLREEAKLSQEQLADKAGLTGATISYLEAGKRSPSFSVIFRLSDALGVKARRLVE